MSHPRKKATTKKQPMHPADIKAALEKSDSSPIAIARSLQISGNSVANVIHRRGKSWRTAQRIAEVTGLPLTTLFGDDYDYAEQNHHAA